MRKTMSRMNRMLMMIISMKLWFEYISINRALVVALSAIFAWPQNEPGIENTNGMRKNWLMINVCLLTMCFMNSAGVFRSIFMSDV